MTSQSINWQPPIEAQNFRQTTYPYYFAILGQAWSLEVPDLHAQDPSLADLLEPYERSIRVAVAGKEEGPDPRALSVAQDVMGQLIAT